MDGLKIIHLGVFSQLPCRGIIVGALMILFRSRSKAFAAAADMASSVIVRPACIFALISVAVKPWPGPYRFCELSDM